jgi:iron complex transport system substrate-binding protein
MNQNTLEQPLTRRRVLGAGVAAGVVVLAGCGSSAARKRGWTFADDRNHTVRLSRRPTRIVAYTTAAVALYDWGITPVGVFGTDPRGDPALARLPWSRVQVVGSVYGEIDVELLHSLKAELIVSRWYPPPHDAPVFGFRDKTTQKRTGLQVPIVGINGHAVGSRQIDRFGDLARALGVNPRSSRIAGARAAFEKAEANLSRIGRKKSNLRIIGVSGDQSTMYVAKLPDIGDLAFYAARGVPMVSAQSSSDVYWDKLPWRQADKYVADGILYDARAGTLPVADAKAFPAFAELPAVRTNQIGKWHGDPPPSYQSYTRTMNELATTIAGWRKVS